MEQSNNPGGDPRNLATETAAGQWDLVLRPQSRWFDLHLGDLWRYRDLIALFVRRDFVALYKQTILGPLWFILQPLLTTAMFSVVFGYMARLSTDGLPKLLFYLSGSILWMYFAGCLSTASDTFITNSSLFGKVYFPRLVVPVSTAVSQLLKLGLQLLLFLILFICYAAMGVGVRVTWAAALLPALVVIMAALSVGLGILISAMTIRYRDLRFLIQFGIQLAMYATTVIYPLSAISDGRVRYFILANPMTPIIETFRYGFLGVGVFSWWHLGYSAVFAACALIAGMLLFARVERTFMDSI